MGGISGEGTWKVHSFGSRELGNRALFASPFKTGSLMFKTFPKLQDTKASVSSLAFSACRTCRLCRGVASRIHVLPLSLEPPSMPEKDPMPFEHQGSVASQYLCYFLGLGRDLTSATAVPDSLFPVRLVPHEGASQAALHLSKAPIIRWAR